MNYGCYSATAFPLGSAHTRVALGERTLLVGVVNVTPDSFSDGGKFSSSTEAVDHALKLLDEGADILDIGGESTRPGTRPPISAQEELDRVLPVIEGILQTRPETILSIDTYKAETASAAVRAGAEIVNDVSGFLWDPAMAAACAELKCGVILMHTRGRSSEWRTQAPLPHNEVVPLVLRELKQRADAAISAGVEQAAIVLDPALASGKLSTRIIRCWRTLTNCIRSAIRCWRAYRARHSLAEGWRRSTGTMSQPISGEMQLWSP